MPDGDLRNMIGPLGRRLVSRQQRMSRATGLGLARSVADRRKPHALQAATRLAVGRSIVPREPAPPAEAEQPVQFPDYISPFAASVLFGDDTAVDAEQATRYTAYQEREEARMTALRTGAVPRGLVQEGPAAYEPRDEDGGAGAFRLSRRPPEPAPAADLPASRPRSERVQKLSTSRKPEAARAPAEAARMAAPEATTDRPAPLQRPVVEPPAAPFEDEQAPSPVVPRLVDAAPPEQPHAPAGAEPAAPAPPASAPRQARRIDRAPAAEPEAPAPAEATPVAASETPEPAAEPAAGIPIESTPTGPVAPLADTSPAPAPVRPVVSDPPAHGAQAIASSEPAPAAPPAAEPQLPAPRPPSPPPSAPEEPVAERPAAEKPRAVAPVLVQRSAPPSPKPERPVVQRRAAGPPPIVEVVSEAPTAPLAVAAPPVEPAPARRGILRRLADSVRGAPRAHEPQQVEPAAVQLSVDALATPAPPPPAETAGAPGEPDRSVPPPERPPARGLRAAVARVLRQPVGTTLPPGLGPSPIPGPGGSGGGAPHAPTTPAPSTPSPAPATPGGGGGTSPGGGAASPGGGTGGGAPSPGGGGSAGGGDGAQVGGNQSVQAESVSMGATTVGGSQNVSSGSTTSIGPTTVGGTQTVTSGAATLIGSAEAGGSQSLKAGGAAVAGPLTAAGAQTVLAGGLVNVKGAITGGGAVSVAAGMVKATGGVTSGGAMALGGAVKAGQVSAGTVIGNIKAGTVINMGGGGGAATGALGGPVSRMAADRPKPVPVQNIRRESAPASIARTPQPSPALPPARPTGTSAAALAAATGGTVARRTGGAETVSFPPPPAPAIQAMSAPPIQRADDASPSSSSSSATQGAPSAPPASADIEELAEKVMEVLKREAMIERERRGDLT